MKVIGIHFDTLGHTAAERNLKEFLPQRYQEVSYEMTSLSEIKRKMGWKSKLLGLIAYPILIQNRFDFTFNRLRSEFAYSCMVYWFFRQLDKTEVDVFHFRTQSICLLVWPFFKKFKTVVTIDMTALQLIELRPHNKWFYLPIAWLEKKVFNSGATIVTYSHHTAANVVNKYGVPPSKCTAIHPSVKDGFYDISHSTQKTPRILFVGNDFKRKGGDLLLQVFQQYFSEKAELHLVSNDPVLSEMEASKGVVLHRNIQPNTSDLIDLFTKADFFVLPTREEAYGIVFSEAMAAGLPCIGTRTMAIPELIGDNKRGFLIEIDHAKQLEEKMRLLIEDTNLRESMAFEARNHAMAHYRLEHFLTHYFQVFQTAGKI